MFAYVARQAILDENKEIYAYELLFRDGKSNCYPDIEPDEATSKLITGSHLALGIEEITNGKIGFINFHTDTFAVPLSNLIEPSKRCDRSRRDGEADRSVGKRVQTHS